MSLLNLFTKKRIFFVYYPPYRFYGTTVMRGQQLSEIAKASLPKKYRVKFTKTDRNYKNSILYLTKWAVYNLKSDRLAELKQKNNVLIFDLVDGKIPASARKYADVVVATSQAAYKLYLLELPSSKRVMLVDHHADPRIKDLNWSKSRRSLKIGYFGELVNTIISPTIKKEVDFIEVSITRQDVSWFKKLPRYNMHYAIRQTQETYPNKPFLKGFTAAHCDANIIIQESQQEAVRWLGKDYPYLLKGRPTEKKILDMIEYAKKSFGSKEWYRGLETMKDMKEKTSEAAIGRQLVELFDQL